MCRWEGVEGEVFLSLLLEASDSSRVGMGEGRRSGEKQEYCLVKW